MNTAVFKDKIAVVTGGASGIGKAIVKALLGEGATVVIADVEQSALDSAVAELSSVGSVSGIQVDVSSAESVNALADKVYAEHGNCHLLFNNAGVAAPSANVGSCLTTPSLQARQGCFLVLSLGGLLY